MGAHRIGCTDCGEVWTSASQVREDCKGYAEWLEDGTFDETIPGGYLSTGEPAFEYDERSGKPVKTPFPA